MHAISDNTRASAPINAKSGPVSSGFLDVWSSLAWAIVIGLSYTGCGARAQENASVLKPNDAILWSADDARDWASAGCSCVGTVGPDGMLNLGTYGSVRVAGLTLTDAKAAISRQIALFKSGSGLAQPEGHAAQSYVLKESDVLTWSVGNGSGVPASPVSGHCQVDRDGIVSLGRYGSVRVAGLTYEQARAAIEKQLTGALTQLGAQLTANSGEGARPVIAPAGFSRPMLLNYTPTTAGNETSVSAAPVARVSLAADQAEGSGPALFLPTNSAPAQPTDAATAVALIPPPDTVFPTPRKGPPSPAGQPVAPPSNLSPPRETLPTARPCGLPDHVPQELSKVSLPPYIIEPPDILLIESTQSLRDQPIRGQHLVRPDGTIGLGIYGSVYVAGMTLEQAQAAVVAQVSQRVQKLDARDLYVDVLAYNSKVYYVITDGGGYGEQVFRFPITGNETVLDAISQIAGLPAVASKKRIWLARPIPGDCQNHQVFPINWIGITQGAVTATNYQILPGDRVYVMANGWITFDSRVAKVLSPFTRMFGFTLLGAETIQTIRNRNGNGTGTGF
jgi:polysaccharide biosynthesis/export protein